MLLTTKWISATSHKQSSFITHSSAWKEWRKKRKEGEKMGRSTFIFWLMKRKLRQFPRLGNKRKRENARGAFKTTMHHNLQTQPWSLICSCTVIHLHQGCQLMLCSVSLCIFSEWQSRTDTLRIWLTVCFQISSLWRRSCRTWTPVWPAPQSRWRKSWPPRPQSLRAQQRERWGRYELYTSIYDWRWSLGKILYSILILIYKTWPLNNLISKTFIIIMY